MFRFKQFNVHHDNSALKVGTDGVLLGAWAKAIKPRTILDIGTGTGLIALMLAQRFAEAIVHAVEPNESAIKDAELNFSQSKYSNRLTLFKEKIQAYNTNLKYELIVSNPPFFQNALKPTSFNKTVAKHNALLSLDDLVKSVKNLLSVGGVFCVILPVDEASLFIHLANVNGLFLQEKTNVRGNIKAPIKRVLMLFKLSRTEIAVNELTLEIDRHNYTQEYIQLTKTFYLKM